jgi:hypothetical protein
MSQLYSRALGSLSVASYDSQGYGGVHVGEWRYGSTILGLGTGWGSGVSFTPRGKSPRYLLHRRLGGPQNCSGRCGVDKSNFPVSGIEP